MTFHLALATASFVLQVGDRLLTLKQESSGPIEWDPYANKTILLLGRNGTAAISYSGLGYIREIPTDRWLAEKIAGPTIDFHGAPAVRFGGPVLDVGPALNAVRGAIEREFSTLPKVRRRQQLHLLISGWTWRRRVTDSRRPRPLMGIIRHYGGYSSPPIGYFLPRYWEWHRELRTGSIGAQPSRRLSDMLNTLAQPGHWNQDDIEELMVAVVRDVADDEATVGKDCMSVLISRSQEIRVRYLRKSSPEEPIRTAYTPWIIGGRIVVPPAVLEGSGFSVSAGGRVIPIDSIPPLQENGSKSFSGQPRRTFIS